VEAAPVVVIRKFTHGWDILNDQGFNSGAHFIHLPLERCDASHVIGQLAIDVVDVSVQRVKGHLSALRGGGGGR
jgi:hypothetical protein